jgi:hypothetical protein
MSRRFKRPKPIYIRPYKLPDPDARCPRCGEGADGATAINDGTDTRAPKPGDYVTCAYCGAFNRYRDDLTQCEATVEELRELEADPRMRELMGLAVEVTLKIRKENRKK